MVHSVMALIDPHEAADLARGRWANRPPLSPLTSFSIDTRFMRPGETFVALKGESRDGHSYLQSARQQNALAAVVEQADPNVELPQLVVENALGSLQSLARAWRRQFNRPVIGISGSYGKTTVKEMLGSVLGSIWFRSHGNFNNHIGVPLSLLELDPRHHAGAILEAGINDVDEMDVLAGLIQPEIAIITAVGPAHLERLGSLETVAREKAVLANAVRPGGSLFVPVSLLRHEAFQKLSGSISVNAIVLDGEPVPEGAGKVRNLNLYHCQWTPTRNSRGLGELATVSSTSPWKFAFQAGSPGMVSNLALVVQAALHLGVPPTTLQRQLDAWRPFRHRGQVVHDGERVFYVDCYNANPGSMMDSASRFNSLFPDRKRVYVLGSMNELGEESDGWHRETGKRMEIAAESTIYLLGHGAEAMAEGFRESGIDSERLYIMDDLRGISEKLSNFKGAIFLKGSRTYQLETLLPGGEKSC